MLSIIIPAFNESYNLKRNIPRLVEYLNSRNIEREIIVSEDGSTDDTCEILKRFSEVYGVLHLHYKKRRGKGAALKKAGPYTKYGKIIFIDADMPVNLDSFETMIKELETNDIVIGSRYLREQDMRTRTFKRLLLGRTYQLLVKVFFPKLKISDTQCGFKGFKRDVFIDLNKKTRTNGWSWDLEFLVNARKRGLKIKELPTRWKDNKKTNVNLFADTFLMFLEIFAIRLATFF